jgi:hypothetical protein
MWIPLDIILTGLIVIYQIFYRYMEKLEEGAAHQAEHHGASSVDTVADSDDYINQNGKDSLGPIEKFSINNNDAEIMKLDMSLFSQTKAASTLKTGILDKFRAIAMKKKKDSIFDFANEKKFWKLTKDASSMGYGAFLTKEFNGGLDFEDE